MHDSLKSKIGEFISFAKSLKLPCNLFVKNCFKLNRIAIGKSKFSLLNLYLFFLFLFFFFGGTFISLSIFFFYKFNSLWSLMVISSLTLLILDPNTSVCFSGNTDALVLWNKSGPSMIYTFIIGCFSNPRSHVDSLTAMFTSFVLPLGCSLNPFVTLTFFSVFWYGILNSCFFLEM